VRVSNEAAGKECCDRWTAGAGAAGGLGYAFARFLHAELVRGIDLVLQEIHLEEAVQTADLVITGEGRMDAQTLMGKTPAGVAGLAKKYNVPVIAYAGCFGEGIEQCVESGLFDRVYAVTEKPGAFDPQMAVRDLGQKVQGTISEWFRMIDSESV
ncbi:MAG: glycerate kinase, partial [Lachnospiraceae bacterium]|nr:glycerate kinase [Lachnospiraceae bacterium]